MTLEPETDGNSDCSTYHPILEREAYKQCLCEHDPSLCPDDVVYFFHSDHLGSSSVLTDSEGIPYQFLVYLPWGEILGEQKAAPFSTPYQFNGKELDSETGLYNYGARYYDPSLSVWLSVDPLADHPNQVDKTPYAYAWNNPVNLIDPDGRCPKCPEGASLGDTYDWGGSTFTFGEGGWATSVDEVTVTAPRSIPLRTAFTEAGADAFGGFSYGGLNMIIDAESAARHGSLEGGTSVLIYGASKDVSLVPSIEFTGVTVGELDYEGFDRDNIAESLIDIKIRTHSFSAGHILNFKTTKVEGSGYNQSYLNGRLYGASLGVSAAPVDYGGGYESLGSNYRLTRPLQTHADSLRYTEKYKEYHSRIDSFYQVLKKQ